MVHHPALLPKHFHRPLHLVHQVTVFPHQLLALRTRSQEDLVFLDGGGAGEDLRTEGQSEGLFMVVEVGKGEFDAGEGVGEAVCGELDERARGRVVGVVVEDRLRKHGAFGRRRRGRAR